jgi:hypothetical protein
VSVYAYDFGHSAFLEQFDYRFYAESLAWCEAFVLAAVGKIGDYGRYAAGFEFLGIVSHQHQL